jgi:hypothetical protein
LTVVPLKDNIWGRSEKVVGAMGLLSDYYENLRTNEYMLEALHAPAWHRPAPPTPRFACPLCAHMFDDEAVRRTHIFTDHAGEQFHLRAGHSVVVSDHGSVGLPDPLEVVISPGKSPVEVEVESGGQIRRSPTMADHGSIDLKALLPITAPSAALVRVRRGRLQREYRLSFGISGQINAEPLDAAVLIAQAPLTVGAEPDWRSLRDLARRPVTDPANGRYLDGFAEYLLGCDLERRDDGSDAWPRLERANALVEEFAAGLAVDLRAILAFRFNAFELLLERGAGSAFWGAANFFRDPPASPGTYRKRTPSARGVWIDDFQEGVLRAVDAYFASDYPSVERELAALPGHLSQIPNNGMKRDLLEARLAHALGDSGRRARAYERLRSSPYFGAEARRHE